MKANVLDGLQLESPICYGPIHYQLMDWLIWYNTERPHWTLRLKSPMKAMLDGLQLEGRQSNMLWTDTRT